MTDKSEEIKARAAKYNKVERVDDQEGRVIGVRLLKQSQRIRIEEMAPGLSGEETMSVKDPETGRTNTLSVPRIARLIWAASVCEVDGSPIPFPKTRDDLDITLDMLDDAGLAAAAAGFVKLQVGDTGKTGDDVVPDAKNSQPTPSSDRSAT